MCLRFLFGLVLYLASSTLAEAKRPKKKGSAGGAENASSPMGNPNLKSVLGKSYDAPPELSDRATPGAIIEVTPQGYTMIMSGCVSIEPVESAFTNITMQSSLSGGVNFSIAGQGAKGAVSKAVELKFVSPYILGFEMVDFEPSEECVSKMTSYVKKRPSTENLYVVQEALFARINGCNAASGSTEAEIAGKGGSASVSASCQMYSNEPVAVGVRTVSLSEFMVSEEMALTTQFPTVTLSNAVPYAAPAVPEVVRAPVASMPDQILSLSGGGSSQWDDIVKGLLLNEYDSNGSGTINTSSEVEAIPCTVFQALDKGILNGGEYTSSLVSLYGFVPDSIWIGYAFGFDENVRSTTYMKASACLGLETTSPATAAFSESTLTSQILSIPGGGSSAWDAVLKGYLLSAYDSNGSGKIDTSSEVSSISCNVWGAIHSGMISGGLYSSSFLTVYGFSPDYEWVGYVVGFSEDVSDIAYSAGANCIGSTTPAPAPSSRGSSGLASQILSLSGGGSSTWDEGVRRLILSEYDSNGSGDLDTSSEVRSVSCSVWGAMNTGMINGGEYTTNILSVYGFDPSLIWVGYAVGFSEDVRTTAFAAGSACLGSGTSSSSGRSSSPSSSGIAPQILGLTRGGSSAWDEVVKTLLISEYDSNRTGEIDTSSEVSAIPCSVWNAMNRGMINGGEYTTNIISVYGFDPAMIWVGYALGFSESVRSAAYSSGASCVGY